MNKIQIFSAILTLISINAFAGDFTVTNNDGKDYSVSIFSCKESNGQKNCTPSPAHVIKSGEKHTFTVQKGGSYWINAGYADKTSGGLINEQVNVPGEFTIKKKKCKKCK